jgi:hypothetical protein
VVANGIAAAKSCTSCGPPAASVYAPDLDHDQLERDAAGAGRQGCELCGITSCTKVLGVKTYADVEDGLAFLRRCPRGQPHFAWQERDILPPRDGYILRSDAENRRPVYGYT